MSYSSGNFATYMFSNDGNKLAQINMFGASYIYPCGICFSTTSDIAILGERNSGYIYVTSASIIQTYYPTVFNSGYLYLYPCATISKLIGLSIDASTDTLYFLSINASNQTIIQSCPVSSLNLNVNTFNTTSGASVPPQLSVSFTLVMNLTTSLSIDFSSLANIPPILTSGFSIFKVLKVNDILYGFLVLNSTAVDYLATLYVVNITSSTLINTITLKQPVYSFEVISNTADNTYTIYYSLAIGRNSINYGYTFAGRFWVYGYIYQIQQTK
jgi:hypothetical protein